MNPTIERLKLIFLGIFAVANVGMLIWQVGWAWPEEKCTQARKWWDGSERGLAEARSALAFSVRTFPFFARAWIYLAWSWIAPRRYAAWRRVERGLKP